MPAHFPNRITSAPLSDYTEKYFIPGFLQQDKYKYAELPDDVQSQTLISDTWPMNEDQIMYSKMSNGGHPINMRPLPSSYESREKSYPAMSTSPSSSSDSLQTPFNGTSPREIERPFPKLSARSDISAVSSYLPAHPRSPNWQYMKAHNHKKKKKHKKDHHNKLLDPSSLSHRGDQPSEGAPNNYLLHGVPTQHLNNVAQPYQTHSNNQTHPINQNHSNNQNHPINQNHSNNQNHPINQNHSNNQNHPVNQNHSINHNSITGQINVSSPVNQGHHTASPNSSYGQSNSSQHYHNASNINPHSPHFQAIEVPNSQNTSPTHSSPHLLYDGPRSRSNSNASNLSDAGEGKNTMYLMHPSELNANVHYHSDSSASQTPSQSPDMSRHNWRSKSTNVLTNNSNKKNSFNVPRTTSISDFDQSPNLQDLRHNKRAYHSDTEPKLTYSDLENLNFSSDEEEASDFSDTSCNTDHSSSHTAQKTHTSSKKKKSREKPSSYDLLFSDIKDDELQHLIATKLFDASIMLIKVCAATIATFMRSPSMLAYFFVYTVLYLHMSQRIQFCSLSHVPYLGLFFSTESAWPASIVYIVMLWGQSKLFTYFLNIGKKKRKAEN